MGGITTHVLDTAKGKPASGVPVRLEFLMENEWRKVAEGKTDGDGRVKTLTTSLRGGMYRLIFDTEAYFRVASIEAFFPNVTIMFEVRDALQHYHVPLLLSPYGYSTYRGS